MSHLAIGVVDSGYGTAGFKAFYNGCTLRQARDNWERSGRHRLWIKGAEGAFRAAAASGVKAKAREKVSPTMEDVRAEIAAARAEILANKQAAQRRKDEAGAAAEEILRRARLEDEMLESMRKAIAVVYYPLYRMARDEIGHPTRRSNCQREKRIRSRTAEIIVSWLCNIRLATLYPDYTCAVAYNCDGLPGLEAGCVQFLRKSDKQKL